MGIRENYERIKSEANGACVIAVTKYVDSEKLIDAYNAGIRNFGENKAQDGQNKRKKLPEEIEKTAVWHFLGHLQTNKVKKVVGFWDLIHSVDSIKLAQCINEAAKSANIVQKILLQVNTANEETKYGFGKEDFLAQYREIRELENIEITGLMTMAPYTNDETIIRQTFSSLRKLKNQLEEVFGDNLKELSMGMSNDYKIAVEEGSTMIRVGQALFISE